MKDKNIMLLEEFNQELKKIDFYQFVCYREQA